ncbi:MAG: type II secretion system major pseudopilin GspG [Planctomycetaceae bacterium]|jgi:general secretion pathway protein G
MRSVSRRFARPSAPRAGFTLMELLIVLAIIGVIAAIAVPALLGQQKKAMIKATMATINGVESALKIYAADHSGDYPAEGLEILISNPGNDKEWSGPYLEGGRLPLDAWGNALSYQFPPQNNLDKPDIWSNGPDRQPNTADDVINWQQ